MRYVEEYRGADEARRYARALQSLVTRPWTLMEVCGGQTHAIVRFGIDQLLPPELTLLHGPGCPVCVTPVEVLDKALAIASRPGVVFCSFGDMLRVPGSGRDLLSVKAAGGDVRIVYSPMDALALAERLPEREVVFFAVGFETTAPACAMAVHEARRRGLRNFSLLVAHVLVPPAMEALLAAPGRRMDGFLAAGHVCTIMGMEAYEPLARAYRVPIVVTGFEPLDLLQGIHMCVAQLESGRATVENQYARAVRVAGNESAQAMLREVFEVVPRTWRGIGPIPASGLGLRAAFADWDAARKFDVVSVGGREDAGCQSGLVLQGRLKPPECPAFGTRCTPDTPLGATMVSSEGACAAYYRYRRFHPPMSADLALSCPVPLGRHTTVQLAHGGGGRLMRQLLEDIFLESFRAPALAERHDSAVVPLGGQRLAFTTDSYVVMPRFFPGGNIGTLAVHGTVNDLAMAGAKPLYLSAGFILEEGLALDELRRVVASMREAARECGVDIVTGDTKVVDRGKADGLFINTSGVGRVPEGVFVHPRRVTPGDAVLVSGDVGRHGIAVLSVREGLAFDTPVVSDCASLAPLVEALFEAGVEVHCLRDATRGGLATALNEIALDAGVGLVVDEPAVPVDACVAGACELLGLDPLYVACEGRMVAFVPEPQVERALEVLVRHPLGAGAARIGRVTEGPAGMVSLRTRLGGQRLLDLLSGEQLPRIC